MAATAYEMASAKLRELSDRVEGRRGLCVVKVRELGKLRREWSTRVLAADEWDARHMAVRKLFGKRAHFQQDPCRPTGQGRRLTQVGASEFVVEGAVEVIVTWSPTREALVSRLVKASERAADLQWAELDNARKGNE